MSSARLFGRRCVLLVGDPPGKELNPRVVNALQVDGLRVTFEVKKSTGKDPNTADVRVFNLKDESRARMQGKGQKLILQAGYEGTVAQLFSGDSTLIDHAHKGPEWETRILCGDGERAYRFARVSESFAPGTRVQDVIAHLARSSGLDLGNALERAAAIQGPLQQYAQGLTLHGRTAGALDQVLRSVGLTWSVQDGALQLLGPAETLPGQVVVVSADTGLVGSPEQGTPDKKGGPQVLKFRVLLNPLLRPGARVLLRSRAHTGTFKLGAVVHRGDTRGTDWYTDVEATPA